MRVRVGGLMFPEGETQTGTALAKGRFEWGKALGWWVGARRVLDDAAAILCVGQKEQEEAQRHYPRKKVVQLPNGVDAHRFAAGDGASFRARHGIAADTFVVLTVGRIDPQKNQLLTVRLLAQLLREHVNAHLVLVGHVTNASYEAQLESEIGVLGLSNRVTLIRGLDTHDPALVNAYHAADLFVLPSVHEPFGIVILEAWAAGLAVVASRVGGVPSFCSHGEDGWLVPPGDADSVAPVVRGLSANPDT